MAGESMGGGRISARHAVADPLGGWRPEDSGRQNRASDGWPPDVWAPVEARTSGWAPGDDRTDAGTGDYQRVEYRDGGGRGPAERTPDGWGQNELTARTSTHDDRPPGGWPRRDRTRTDRISEARPFEDGPARQVRHRQVRHRQALDEPGPSPPGSSTTGLSRPQPPLRRRRPDAREQRRRSVADGLFRERADRAPGGMFDDSPYPAELGRGTARNARGARRRRLGLAEQDLAGATGGAGRRRRNRGDRDRAPGPIGRDLGARRDRGRTPRSGDDRRPDLTAGPRTRPDAGTSPGTRAGLRGPGVPRPGLRRTGSSADRERDALDGPAPRQTRPRRPRIPTGPHDRPGAPARRSRPRRARAPGPALGVRRARSRGRPGGRGPRHRARRVR